MKLNLNEIVKVKLTDCGKDIYFHQFDRINEMAQKEIIKPHFPKVDEDGYTKFQLWDFMNLYGKYMVPGEREVVNPLEIVFDEEKPAYTYEERKEKE